jgi:6-pyruvoyltetrahydropterin/6-carboxytetrahydropterin synthase
MYELKVFSYFAAAHQLKNYGGKCEHLHGHNWKVEVLVESDKLDDVGLAVDFRELKEVLGDVLSEFDHKNLNDLPMFKEENPSSENIARRLYEKLSAALSDFSVRVGKVCVWESENCCASYFPAPPATSGSVY